MATNPADTEKLLLIEQAEAVLKRLGEQRKDLEAQIASFKEKDEASKLNSGPAIVVEGIDLENILQQLRDFKIDLNKLNSLNQELANKIKEARKQLYQLIIDNLSRVTFNQSREEIDAAFGESEKLDDGSQPLSDQVQATKPAQSQITLTENSRKWTNLEIMQRMTNTKLFKDLHQQADGSYTGKVNHSGTPNVDVKFSPDGVSLKNYRTDDEFKETLRTTLKAMLIALNGSLPGTTDQLPASMPHKISIARIDADSHDKNLIAQTLNEPAFKGHVNYKDFTLPQLTVNREDKAAEKVGEEASTPTPLLNVSNNNNS